MDKKTLAGIIEELSDTATILSSGIKSKESNIEEVKTELFEDALVKEEDPTVTKQEPEDENLVHESSSSQNDSGVSFTTNSMAQVFPDVQGCDFSLIPTMINVLAAQWIANLQQQQPSLDQESPSSPGPIRRSCNRTVANPARALLVPYITPLSSLSTTKKRMNRGRAFKAHKGSYNAVVNEEIVSAKYDHNALRLELASKQAELDPIIVEEVDVTQKLAATIDLIPILNTPSQCGAVVSGHIFPRNFFTNHILRDVEGNVKAAKGFINHSNRDPVSHKASKLFYDVLYYFGGSLIEPDMLESWMWVARKGVNDRGNTSKGGRNVKYYVNSDYDTILQDDIWAQEENGNQ